MVRDPLERLKTRMQRRQKRNAESHFDLLVVEDQSCFPSPAGRVRSAVSKTPMMRVGQPIPAGQLADVLVTHLPAKRVPEVIIQPALPHEASVMLRMTLSSQEIHVEVFGDPTFGPLTSAVAASALQQTTDADGNPIRATNDLILSVRFDGEEKVRGASDFCQALLSKVLTENGTCEIVLTDTQAK